MKKWFEQIRWVLLVAFVVSLPFSIRVSAILAGGVAVSSIIVGLGQKEKFKSNLKTLFRFGWPILFGFMLISVFWHGPNPFGWKFVERQMGLVALVISVAAEFDFTKRFRQIRWIIIATLLLATFVCFTDAFLRFYDTYGFIPSRLSHFSQYSKEFSYVFLIQSTTLQASYFSLYLSIVVILCLDFANTASRRASIWLYVLVAYFMGFNVLVGSKAGAVIAVLAIGLYFILQSIKTKRYQMLFISGAIVVLGISAIFINPYTRARFNQMYKTLSLEQSEAEKVWDPLGLRLRLWKTSVDLLKQHPITGVGVGYIKDELDQACLELYDPYLCDQTKRMESHNQWLNYSVSMGIPVGLFFLALLGYRIYKGWKGKSITYLVFLAIFISNILVESILNKHAGILLIILMDSYFLLEIARRDLSEPDPVPTDA
ncbi:MAG TPA: hypothetical protein DCE41_09660 [Cytophagales bacterium]|nr:hypothetical protein [Cytophagales bacterium]HAA18403.1 hypothetical protein [Cytophagales bacterium]HAP61452.1 hypothetical protein [Cytophagales bacterium]